MKFKYLASNFILYAFATGVNKGVLLLTIPLLSRVLSLESYGLWSLSQVIIALCAPLLSLNGYSSILRFGIQDKEKGFTIFKKYFIYTIIICLFNLLFFLVYGINWISLTLLLAQLEGFQSLILGWCRSRDYVKTYFFISLAKIFSITACVLLLNLNSLKDLLIGQLLFGSIILLAFYLSVFFREKTLKMVKVKMREIINFSLYLVPHSLSLWILSSSDRFIVKNLLTNLELGLYSLAYSLALVLMLVNSGIALSLPNYVINKYEYYVNSNLKVKMIFIYSIISIFLNITLYCFILFFKEHVDYLREVDNNLYIIIIWILNGIYVLGLYYFYSNILFYHQKAKLISLITLVVSILNIVFTLILVNYIGMKGAAIATFFSYLIYLILNIINSYKIEETIKKDMIYVCIILFITVFINFQIITLLPALK